MLATFKTKFNVSEEELLKIAITDPSVFLGPNPPNLPLIIPTIAENLAAIAASASANTGASVTPSDPRSREGSVNVKQEQPTAEESLLTLLTHVAVSGVDKVEVESPVPRKKIRKEESFDQIKEEDQDNSARAQTLPVLTS